MYNRGQCFKDDLAVLEQKKKDFIVERSGSYTYLKYEGKRLQYGPADHGNISGAHLSKIVRADVDKLVTLKQSDPYYPYDPPSVYVHQVNAANVVGEYIFQIDIKNCYWQTALTEGIISKDTYLKGLRKREWKVGRNAAIGSLDKKTVVTQYKNGEEVDSERFLQPMHYRFAREKVIRTVDRMAQDVINSVCEEGEFLMFVTDCFFVTSSAVQKIRKYLTSKGYGYTEACVVIRAQYTEKKVVVWDKIETIYQGPGKPKIMKTEKDKFIHYTSHSII